MLSTAPVVAFGFLDGASGSVTVQGALQMQEGKALTLVGGDISVEGGHLVARNSLVNLVSAKAKGEVAIDPVTSAVDAGSIGVQGRIEMHNAASVDVSGEGGGQVVIRGGRLVVEEDGVRRPNSLRATLLLGVLPGLREAFRTAPHARDWQ